VRKKYFVCMLSTRSIETHKNQSKPYYTYAQESIKRLENLPKYLLLTCALHAADANKYFANRATFLKQFAQQTLLLFYPKHILCYH